MVDKMPENHGLPLAGVLMPGVGAAGGLYALAGMVPSTTSAVEAPPPRKHGGRALKADDDDDEHPERKRNRAAVRNYRARKKAYTAQLEEEVKQLRLQNFLLMRNFNGNEMDANSTALAANSLSSQPPIIIPGQQEKLAAQILALQQAQAPPAPQPNLLGLGAAEVQKGKNVVHQQDYQPVQPLPVNMMNMIKEQAAADARKQVETSMVQQEHQPETSAAGPGASGGLNMDPQANLIRQLLESSRQQQNVQQQQIGMLGLGQRVGAGMGLQAGGQDMLLQQLQSLQQGGHPGNL